MCVSVLGVVSWEQVLEALLLVILVGGVGEGDHWHVFAFAVAVAVAAAPVLVVGGSVCALAARPRRQ